MQLQIVHFTQLTIIQAVYLFNTIGQLVSSPTVVYSAIRLDIPGILGIDSDSASLLNSREYLEMSSTICKILSNILCSLSSGNRFFNVCPKDCAIHCLKFLQVAFPSSDKQ